MGEYFVHPRVNDNLWVIHNFIARRNPEAADRVIDAAYRTFQALADQPGLGKPYSPRNRKIQGVRCRKIQGFENYQIFYREVPGGIEVIRVYSRFRNISRLFRRE